MVPERADRRSAASGDGWRGEQPARHQQVEQRLGGHSDGGQVGLAGCPGDQQHRAVQGRCHSRPGTGTGTGAGPAPEIAAAGTGHCGTDCAQNRSRRGAIGELCVPDNAGGTRATSASAESVAPASSCWIFARLWPSAWRRFTATSCSRWRARRDRRTAHGNGPVNKSGRDVPPDHPRVRHLRHPAVGSAHVSVGQRVRHSPNELVQRPFHPPTMTLSYDTVKQIAATDAATSGSTGGTRRPAGSRPAPRRPVGWPARRSARRSPPISPPAPPRRKAGRPGTTARQPRPRHCCGGPGRGAGWSDGRSPHQRRELIAEGRPRRWTASVGRPRPW